MEIKKIILLFFSCLCLVTVLRAMKSADSIELTDFSRSSKNGANVAVAAKNNTAQKTPLHKAVIRGDLETLRLLLTEANDVNVVDDLGWTPLHWVGFNGNYGMVALLIASGADVHAKDRRGATALHVAVSNWVPCCFYHIVRDLVKYGADINAADNAGATPLHWALRDRISNGTVYVLLEQGADVKKADRNGFVPLHWLWDHDFCQSLVLRGADVNAINDSGDTPLHTAARKGYEMPVKNLIECGAQVNVKNKAGERPLDVAVKEGKDKVVELLLANGVCSKPKDPVPTKELVGTDWVIIEHN